MGSRSKKRTTMAKLARESALRERRVEKQAKKDMRKQSLDSRPDATSDAHDRSTNEQGLETT